LEVAPASPEEVIVRGWMAAVTEMLSVTFAVRVGEAESATVKVREELPGVVGVPEMMPLLARVSPAGRPVADQL
jgi:hypothetical protein